MRRALFIIITLMLVCSLACLAGTQKKPVKGHGNNPLNITNLPLDANGNILIPDMVVGTPYTYQFTAAGGVPCKLGNPYTFALDSGTLPPGMNLSSTGTMSGTLLTAGDYTFTVSVTDCGP